MDGFDILFFRVSFNWEVNDDLILWGGVGCFYGGMFLVWIFNVYINDGVINDLVIFFSLDVDLVDFIIVLIEV